MKKIVLIITLFICFSCSSDSNSDTPTSEKNLVVGLWLENQIFYDGEEKFYNDCEKLDEREFYPNGTFRFNYHEDLSDMPCFVDGEELGKWEVNGTELKITFDELDEDYSPTDLFEILSLTENKMRIRSINNQYSDQVIEIVYVK